MKFKAMICSSLLLINTTIFAGSSPEIRKITPPKLDEAHISKKVLCHRPVKKGAPKFDVEARDGKVIAHDYGHGGSGITLAPGSASYVNDLLIHSPHSHNLTQKSPITIIGAGVIGLFTAYDLHQKGYKNITIIADKFEDLTSHRGGGQLAPVAISMSNGAEIQNTINKIGIDSYKFYSSIAKGEHEVFKTGASIMPNYFKTREDSALEPYVGVVMQPAKDVILDFGNGTKQAMVAYDDSVFVNTSKMMENLTTYLKAKGVKFVQKKVTSFDEVGSKFIFNCAGLGAKELNKDQDLTSVQGHLLMLKDQNPKDLQYMIFVTLGKDKTTSGQEMRRSFFMFPKHLPGSNENDVGVIGGTYIENATSKTPHEEEFDIMLQKARDFYGIK